MTYKQERRPIPDDFVEVCKTVKRSHLAKHYATSNRLIQRWFAELNMGTVRNKAPANKKAAPADFFEMAPLLSKSQLVKHYETTKEVIARWIEETGATPKRASNPLHSFIPSLGRGIHKEMTRHCTPEDEAADLLRRKRWIVHRCDKRGQFDLRGAFWRVGNIICTPDELLQRADRYRSRAA